MSDYDPQRDRRRPTEAAIDAVMGAEPPDGAGAGSGAGPDEPASSISEPVIDLSEPAHTGLSSPAVTPDPAPSDEVLVRLGMAGGFASIVGAVYLWRRLRRRRRSA